MPAPTTSAPPAGGWPSAAIRTSTAATPRRCAGSTRPPTSSSHELGACAERRSAPSDAAHRESPPARRPPSAGRVDHDVASFVIEALPVVAFEALLVVTSWIGEVVVDEPPVSARRARARPAALLVPARPRARRRSEHGEPDDRRPARRAAARHRRCSRPVGRLAQPPREMTRRSGAPDGEHRRAAVRRPWNLLTCWRSTARR